jgi:hypothetical protein
MHQAVTSQLAPESMPTASGIGTAVLRATPPEAALSAIGQFAGPILVDLDETLYLRNSTEDFIDCALPGTLAVFLMRVMELMKPWRLFGGEATRDVWRVRLILVLFPWTIWRWRRRVVQLASVHGNHALIERLRLHEHADRVIVTNGFGPVVAPLVAALGLQETRMVAARAWDEADRRDGKLKMARAALGTDLISRAMVVTDSAAHDSDLLAACASPVLTTWPNARYVPAFSRVYFPGDYISRVKRPGERFIIRGVLQEDFAYWLLSSVALAATPLQFVAGMLLLLVSFWAIYEHGYVDNDLVAATLEKNPKLSAAYHLHPVATPRWQPWIWASAFGAAGIYLVNSPQPFPPLDFLKWVAGLGFLYYWFWLYNRFDKVTRVWMFPVLQLARAAAFVVVTPVLTIGAITVGAHALSRWVPYYIYRFGNKDWPEAQPQMTRLLFLTVFTVLICAAEGPAFLLSWTTLAIFLYTIFRARHEMMTFFGKVSRLDRQPPRSLP